MLKQTCISLIKATLLSYDFDTCQQLLLALEHSFSVPLNVMPFMEFQKEKEH